MDGKLTICDLSNQTRHLTDEQREDIYKQLEKQMLEGIKEGENTVSIKWPIPMASLHMNIPIHENC